MALETAGWVRRLVTQGLPPNLWSTRSRTLMLLPWARVVIQLIEHFSLNESPQWGLSGYFFRAPPSRRPPHHRPHRPLASRGRPHAV